MSRLYRITKSHTRGLLFGMVTEEVTPVHFFAGHVVKNAIGGGDYRVIIVEDIGEKTVPCPKCNGTKVSSYYIAASGNRIKCDLCGGTGVDQYAAQRGLIVPTHAPTTAAEHNKFPKGRW